MRIINFLIASAIGWPAHAETTTLIHYLTDAWQKSPEAKAEKNQIEASDQFVSSARGKYFPHLSLEALDTTGFPASNSDLHIGGVMGSPYRSGWAYGAVLEQTVYDFGRIGSALQAAKAEKNLSEAKLAEEKLTFLNRLGGLYIECARAKSLQATIIDLSEWDDIILKETARFTRTGQRSIVDNALVRAEIDDLRLEGSDLKKFESSAVGRLRLYATIGECQPLAEEGAGHVPEELQVPDPVIILSKARKEVAQASLESARAAQLPSIKVTGSAGDMDKARLVPKDNYSAGIGVSFPVWNGGEDAHRAEAFRSEVEVQNDSLKAAQLAVEAQIKRLRDDVQRDRQTLKMLDENLEHVRSTMKLASKRYVRLEGTLVDVREAFKQLKALEYQRVQLLYDLTATSFQLNVLKAE